MDLFTCIWAHNWQHKHRMDCVRHIVTGEHQWESSHSAGEVFLSTKYGEKIANISYLAQFSQTKCELSMHQINNYTTKR